MLKPWPTLKKIPSLSFFFLFKNVISKRIFLRNYQTLHGEYPWKYIKH